MTPSSRLFSSLLLSAVMAALLFTVARADDADSSTIQFSDPSKPGTLKIAVTTGDLRITGGQGADITVVSEMKPQSKEQRKDGLRVLTSSSSFSLTEKDNVVTLSYGSDSWPNQGGDFDITVPKNTNVVVSSALGGDIRVAGVSGDLEIKSLNGEVTLVDVSGGALVETMNGEIDVNVVSVTENKPLSFTSMNGEVLLKIPRETKANIRLRTHNGSILTDFDEKQLVTKTTSLKTRSKHERGLDSEDAAEIRQAVRDAVRVGMDAAREAARAAQEALRDHRDASVEVEEPEEEEVASVVPVAPVPPLPPMTGGKIVSGTLNGGGPEIRVTTMNGDVTLRKTK